MPILGVVCTVKQELRKLHTTLGGVGLFHLLMEQLICWLNMLLQHYHTSTALKKKLDSSIKYLQLQLGAPIICSPCLPNSGAIWTPYCGWRCCGILWTDSIFNCTWNILLYPSSKSKIRSLWKSSLAMYPQRQRSKVLAGAEGSLQCIFLSDLVMADGRYLESFVFNPGPPKQRSTYSFPCECPTKTDCLISGKNYATSGGKLKVPLGQWTNPTHRKWLWYASLVEDLHRVENGVVYHYLPSQSRRRTLSGLGYALAWKEPLRNDHILGQPVSIQGSDNTHIYKI